MTKRKTKGKGKQQSKHIETNKKTQSSSTATNLPVTGLFNGGVHCYLNASVQAVARIPGLYDALQKWSFCTLQLSHESHLEVSAVGAVNPNNALSLLTLLIRDLLQSKSHQLDPRRFRNYFFSNTYMEDHRMQDAMEFLACFMDLVEREEAARFTIDDQTSSQLNEKICASRNPLSSAFQGHQLVLQQCEQCRTIKARCETFFFLCLPMLAPAVPPPNSAAGRKAPTTRSHSTGEKTPTVTTTDKPPILPTECATPQPSSHHSKTEEGTGNATTTAAGDSPSSSTVSHVLSRNQQKKKAKEEKKQSRKQRHNIVKKQRQIQPEHLTDVTIINTLGVDTMDVPVVEPVTLMRLEPPVESSGSFDKDLSSVDSGIPSSLDGQDCDKSISPMEAVVVRRTLHEVEDDEVELLFPIHLPGPVMHHSSSHEGSVERDVSKEASDSDSVQFLNTLFNERFQLDSDETVVCPQELQPSSSSTLPTESQVMQIELDDIAAPVAQTVLRDFFDLDIRIPSSTAADGDASTSSSANSLEQLLYETLQAHPIDGQVECDRCSGQKTSRRLRHYFYASLPPVLMLQLKRFYSKKDGVCGKDSRMVPFHELLAVPLVKEDGDIVVMNYELLGVICHQGRNLNSGHYINYAKIRLTDEESCWVEFNDLSTRRINWETVSSSCPYAFLYVVAAKKE